MHLSLDEIGPWPTISVSQSVNELELAKEKVRADQEQVQSLSSLAGYRTVTAPFDGIITERNVHPGALVGPPPETLQNVVPMLRIEQIAHLRLTVPVPEADTSAVAEGTKVKFQVGAWRGRYFTGTISRLSHWVDPRTRTMAVEADVYQNTPSLDPGMFADVIWPQRGEAPALFVPASAVVETAEAAFVERVRQGKVERVPVSRGSTMGELVEVFGSPNAGDAVVVRGSEDLANGARVTAHPMQSQRLSSEDSAIEFSTHRLKRIKTPSESLRFAFSSQHECS